MSYDRLPSLRIEPAERVIMQAASSAARERWSTSEQWDATMDRLYASRGDTARRATVYR